MFGSSYLGTQSSPFLLAKYVEYGDRRPTSNYLTTQNSNCPNAEQPNFGCEQSNECWIGGGFTINFQTRHCIEKILNFSLSLD